MTLPPDKIGDKGQRYEIWCDDADGTPLRVGWSDTPDGFEQLVELHPSWTNHRAIDRWATRPKDRSDDPEAETGD
jgi:hypothetical protein